MPSNTLSINITCSEANLYRDYRFGRRTLPYCIWCSCCFMQQWWIQRAKIVVFPDVGLLRIELRHLQEHPLDAYCPAAAALAPHILLSAVHFIPLSKWQAEAGAPLPVLILAPKAEVSDRAYLLLSLSSGRVMWSWPPAPMSWHCYDCWGKTECWKRKLAFQFCFSFCIM